MTTDRQETLRDKIATVIQEGHTAKQTSDEIALAILRLLEVEQDEAFRRITEFHD